MHCMLPWKGSMSKNKTSKDGSTYRDFDMAFRAHPVTGDLVMKTDVAAVIQSVRNLVLTSPGEILMEPNIGGGVYDIIFELNTTMLRMQLHDKILRTITLFEPRVEISNLTISTIAGGQGIMVSITFYILNNPDPVTENIPLKRTR